MLESLFDIELYDQSREFKKVKVDNYKYHIYNIYTIVRNIVGCYKKATEVTQILADGNFSNLLATEIQTIAKLYSGHTCKPVLFYPDYTPLYKAYNMHKENIETATYKQHMAMRSFLANYNNKNKIDAINKKGYLIPKEYAGHNTLLTTHIGLDLFNKGDFKLLESHTGALKSRSEFPTKYRTFGQTNFKNIPWCEELYFLLGDHCFVKTSPIKAKKNIVDMFNKLHVNLKTPAREVGAMLRRDITTGMFVGRFNPQYGYF